jgi:hypothetical protein
MQLNPSPVPDTHLPFNGSTSSISLPSVLSKSEPYLKGKKLHREIISIYSGFVLDVMQVYLLVLNT